MSVGHPGAQMVTDTVLGEAPPRYRLGLRTVEQDRVGPSFLSRLSRSWRWGWHFSDAHHKVKLSPKTDPSRPLGCVLLSPGQWMVEALPKANSSCSADIHLGGGPGQAGEQRWEENPFQILIGPPTQKATCQATNCQGPANPS